MPNTEKIVHLRLIEKDEPKMLSLSSLGVINGTGITLTRNGNVTQISYGIKDEGQYNKLREIFGACSGAAMYRREMLDYIGLFDEDFFAYFDDVDLALRARLMGWKCFYVPKAVVYHIHSASSSPL